MEVVLNEKKAILNGINIQECYDRIDRYFHGYGVKRLSMGTYLGKDEDFPVFMGAQAELPRTNWFLKIVDEWYFRYDGDEIKFREDALESYYRIIGNKYGHIKQTSNQF